MNENFASLNEQVARFASGRGRVVDATGVTVGIVWGVDLSGTTLKVRAAVPTTGGSDRHIWTTVAGPKFDIAWVGFSAGYEQSDCTGELLLFGERQLLSGLVAPFRQLNLPDENTDHFYYAVSISDTPTEKIQRSTVTFENGGLACQPLGIDGSNFGTNAYPAEIIDLYQHFTPPLHFEE